MLPCYSGHLHTALLLTPPTHTLHCYCTATAAAPTHTLHCYCRPPHTPRPATDAPPHTPCPAAAARRPRSRMLCGRGLSVGTPGRACGWPAASPRSRRGGVRGRGRKGVRVAGSFSTLKERWGAGQGGEGCDACCCCCCCCGAGGKALGRVDSLCARTININM